MKTKQEIKSSLEALKKDLKANIELSKQGINPDDPNRILTSDELLEYHEMKSQLDKFVTAKLEDEKRQEAELEEVRKKNEVELSQSDAKPSVVHTPVPPKNADQLMNDRDSDTRTFVSSLVKSSFGKQ